VRVGLPPSTLTGEAWKWARKVSEALNGIPKFSYTSYADPNSNVSGGAGDVLINLVSNASVSRMWIKQTDTAATTGWVESTTSGAGTSAVNSVSGTANRITVSPTTGACVVDISSGYAGQTSITTLGTIASGTWQGTSIATAYTVAQATSVNGTANRITASGSSSAPVLDIASTYTGQASISVVSSVQASITTAANLVAVGALDSGSIVSTFGAIDIGADALTAGYVVLSSDNPVRMSGSGADVYMALASTAAGGRQYNIATGATASGNIPGAGFYIYDFTGSAVRFGITAAGIPIHYGAVDGEHLRFAYNADATYYNYIHSTFNGGADADNYLALFVGTAAKGHNEVLRVRGDKATLLAGALTLGAVAGTGTGALYCGALTATTGHFSGTNAYNAATPNLLVHDDANRTTGLWGSHICRMDGDVDDLGVGINYLGYNGGTTRFRDFDVFNGKSVKIVAVTGSTGALTLGSVAGTGTGALYCGALTATTGHFDGLLTADLGLTVTSGQTLTVTGCTITGLTAASVGAGTFPAGAFTFGGDVTISKSLTNDVIRYTLNGGAGYIDFGLLGPSYSTSGAFVADSAGFYTSGLSGGINFYTANSGDIVFWYGSGNGTEGFRFSGTTGAITTGLSLLVGTSLTVTQGFGCNSKAAQTAYASGGAAPAGGTGATEGAYDTAAHRDALITLVNNIRAALVANGIMS